MFCPQCGEQIPDSAKFCPRCGCVLEGRKQPANSSVFSGSDASASHEPSLAPQALSSTAFTYSAGEAHDVLNAAGVRQASQKQPSTAIPVAASVSTAANPMADLIIDVVLGLMLCFLPWVKVNFSYFGSQSFTLFGAASQVRTLAGYIGNKDLQAISFFFYLIWGIALMCLVSSGVKHAKGASRESLGAGAVVSAAGITILTVFLINAAIASQSDGSYLGDSLASAASSIMSATGGCWLSGAAGIVAAVYQGSH